MNNVLAPFRVNAPGNKYAAARSAAAYPAPAGSAASVQDHDGDPWLTRLVKLIPAEIIAVYLAGYQLANSFPGLWSFTCLLLVLVSRIWGTKETGKPVQWTAVLVSSVSFIIWVYAMGNYFFNWQLPADYVGVPSLAVLVWTFVVPYFYKGDQ